MLVAFDISRRRAQRQFRLTRKIVFGTKTPGAMISASLPTNVEEVSVNHSINPTRTSSVVLRLILSAMFACGLAIGCGPQAAQAQQTSVVGQWRTILPTGTLTLTFQANGQYSQLGVPPNGGTPLAQSGPYALIAPNTIVFSVTDWSPKTRIDIVPCGIPNEPTCNFQRVDPIPKPPGSRYAYAFNGPNSITLSNETARETITLTRVK
jgi:hypothetical protein